MSARRTSTRTRRRTGEPAVQQAMTFRESQKTIELAEELGYVYREYAHYTLLDRAIADVRDGFKPVHRRIVYAMGDMHLGSTAQHRKSARVVGEVLGKYHPHGDQSVYDALARMAQDFSLRDVLIDGQGNFGSIDGDSPAAMRYTEVRLDPLGEELLQDINMDTVDWQDNFDNSLKEPTVLPARFPNILVNGSSGIAVGFAANLAPISLLILAAFVGLCWFLFKRDMRTSPGHPLDIEALETDALITDRPMLVKALIVMGGVIVGFLLHGALHLEPATIALTGATLLLLWTRSDPHHVLQDIEWTTLFFFIGLFITVEAVVQVGIIETVADAALRLTGGDLALTSTLLLWLSAVASGIVDNIPYTATVIPVVENLGRVMPVEPLWWSLALGACLGGNATLVGASANVVVASLAERSGHPISFRQFLKYGLITTGMSLLLATGYLWLRYL